MATLTFDMVIHWLRHRGGSLYAGEPVTQLEHALQCAAQAQAEGAGAELVTAALLHDICHLAEGMNDQDHPHAKVGAQMLSDLFPAAVTEPVRLHVLAKRYLCVVEPLYWSDLSDMSKRSLIWQGGPFSPDEAVAFISQPYAEEAVRLRRWDDAAKIPGLPTPALDRFISTMQSVALPGRESA
jgi:phosphonate degradation associated HDIG domain protein